MTDAHIEQGRLDRVHPRTQLGDCLEELLRPAEGAKHIWIGVEERSGVDEPSERVCDNRHRLLAASTFLGSLLVSPLEQPTNGLTADRGRRTVASAGVVCDYRRVIRSGL
jgi:hypothetical protein